MPINTLYSFKTTGTVLKKMSFSMSSSPTITDNNANVSISLVPINQNKRSQQNIIVSERLNFEIYRYSSYAQNYTPENVLVDCPNDQTSRWSAYTNTPPQFLTLKLRRPAIVKNIKFGKFEKSHVCNIKKFKVFGGLDEEHMVLLLEGGLKNDNIAETFSIRCLNEDRAEHFPILYIKIVPILSWGPSFNFSIWYIELHGQDDPIYTCARMKNYNTLREIEIIKLCLKHFRQEGYMSAFGALQNQTNVRLEHPLISQLHKHLVVGGDFEKAECFIEDCIEGGLMDEYLTKQDYKHTWHLNRNDSATKPGNRGGHQLLVDSKNRFIYLYGGWDGYQDLSDLWLYDLDEWTLLCERSELLNGPTPRSCHKMIFDPISENIFMLGRYLDNSIRTSEYIKSDFYLYDTRARTWMQICDDTSQVGGPQLVYDHQMCIDADKRFIYVFGGKILTSRNVNATASIEPEYSGLYSYHIATNTWTQILVDCHHHSASQADVMSIKSRITHCMVFHNKHRKLYIYGGQRGKEDLDEFLCYDVDTQAISVLGKEHTHQGMSANSNDAKMEPSSGYTLRATIDCDRDEIYVFSSLSKVKDRRDFLHVDASNSFWVYSLVSHKWSRIYYCRYYGPNILGGNYKGPGVCGELAEHEPCPRYAHQLVYDDVEKMHYLFGGNPGINQHQQLRLDDLWLLFLEKPKREAILTHCRYMLRKLKYEEMARQYPLKAMLYLRQNIAAVVDHSDPEQLKKFHKLASLLFQTSRDIDSGGESQDSDLHLIMDGANSTQEVQVGESSNITPIENVSLESNESISTMGISDKLFRSETTSSVKQLHTECHSHSDSKSKRACLFNKLVRFMPSSMVQPEGNLSDFIVI
ncbi:uncharacterized protein Dwil_GK23081 [Drosophila willistoni]|uniref:Muskelin N-terminal domain-containing protein n=1 Tax=Drosophila willistoni TaxID=7260 RepID=B4NMI5_DROWI|nr:muskelin isoform X1 [Drosophila willistoni]EDW85574.2 uncharacterized protein Dwil_GK23081 [Drosophila willistoni]